MLHLLPTRQQMIRMQGKIVMHPALNSADACLERQTTRRSCSFFLGEICRDVYAFVFTPDLCCWSSFFQLARVFRCEDPKGCYGLRVDARTRMRLGKWLGADGALHLVPDDRCNWFYFS